MIDPKLRKKKGVTENTEGQEYINIYIIYILENILLIYFLVSNTRFIISNPFDLLNCHKFTARRLYLYKRNGGIMGRQSYDKVKISFFDNFTLLVKLKWFSYYKKSIHHIYTSMYLHIKGQNQNNKTSILKLKITIKYLLNEKPKELSRIIINVLKNELIKFRWIDHHRNVTKWA